MSVTTRLWLGAALFFGASVHGSPSVAAETDLALDVAHDASVYTSDPVHYDLTVTNLSADTAEGVVVTFRHFDTPLVSAGGEGWTCTTGDGGGGAVDEICQLDAPLAGNTAVHMGVVIRAMSSPGWFSPAIWVNSLTHDPDRGNNDQHPQTAVNEREPPTTTEPVDLRVSAVHPAQIYRGDLVHYSLTVANLSDVAATTVALTGHVPPEGTLFSVEPGEGWTCSTGGEISCSRASLAARATSTVTVLIRAEQGEWLSPWFDVSSTVEDPDYTNNHAQASTRIAERPQIYADLRLDVVHDTPVYTRDPVRYDISVANESAITANEVVLRFRRPEGLPLLSTEVPGWSCAQEMDLICRRAEPLPPGATDSLGIVIEAPANSGSFNALMSVASSNGTFSGNESASPSTTVLRREVDLVAALDGPDELFVGAEFSHTASVRNASSLRTHDVVAGLFLPDNATLVRVTSPGWTCMQEDWLQCQFGGWLDGGATATITVTMRAPQEETMLQTFVATHSGANETNQNDNSALKHTYVKSCSATNIAAAEPDPEYKIHTPGGKKVRVFVTDGNCVTVDEQVKLP